MRKRKLIIGAVAVFVVAGAYNAGSEDDPATIETTTGSVAAGTDTASGADTTGEFTTAQAASSGTSGTVNSTTRAGDRQGSGGAQARVSRVVDGDTLELSDGRRVRLLGIDSCEADTGAGPDATADAVRLVEGEAVVLRTEPGVDLDRYGRLLRYVALPDGSDFGRSMIRFPHTGIYSDGGDANPGYLASLRAADDGPRVCGGLESTPEPQPQPQPEPTHQPEPAPEREPEVDAVSNCHPSYQPCIPNGGDLDCKQIGHSVSVIGPDEYRLDADDDGTGCDSYS